MTNDQIRQTLFTTTDKTELDIDPTDENTTEVQARNVIRYPDSKYGWGMLNEDRALGGPGAFINIVNIIMIQVHLKQMFQQ